MTVSVARTASRGVSKKCEQCSAVKRCRMYTEIVALGKTGRMATTVVYLCAPCAKDLGFAGS